MWKLEDALGVLGPENWIQKTRTRTLKNGDQGEKPPRVIILIAISSTQVLNILFRMLMIVMAFQ